MKIKSIVLATLVCGAIISGPAIAGGKVKPPVAEKSMVSPWYQPVIDLFSIG